MVATKKNGWASLDTDQRNALLDLYDGGEEAENLSKLAQTQYGVLIKSNTLARRLREWRALDSGNSEDLRKGVQVSGNENQLDVACVSERIRTVDEALKAAEVDLDVWEVSHHIVNTYESFRKKLDKDLKFRKGVVTGHTKDRGGVTIVPLYQVKVWLVRKDPIKIMPVVEPISFKGITFPKPAVYVSKGLRKAALLFDPQMGFARENINSSKLIPFHDRGAMDIALQIVEKEQPDDIFLGGDIFDLTDWTDRFIRQVEFMNLTQPAFVEGAWWMANLRMAAPDAVIEYLEGNHEVRLVNAMLTNMAAAVGIKKIKFGDKEVKIELENDPMVSIPNYLSLDEIGINYIGGYPGTRWLNEVLRIEHGDIARAKPLTTVAALLKDRSESVICGHIHRSEIATKTLYERSGVRGVSAWAIACLCHIDGRVPGHNPAKQHWQQGLGIVEYAPEGTYFNMNPIRIERGKALYNGEYIEARDRLADLRENTGWEF